MTRSRTTADKKYRAHCWKTDYLRDLDPGKKTEIHRLSEQLFKHCLNAGIGERFLTVKPYIPNDMVSSETAWAVCSSLAATELDPDYPFDFQDQDLQGRFLEQLSNVGFDTEGDPIAVIEELQTPELKQKQDYLQTLSLTERWGELHRLRSFLFDYLVSRWIGWEEDIIPEELAQYICQQLAGVQLFSDYPITTQDRYIGEYFRSLTEKVGPFNANAISFDKAIATLHQWMNSGKDDHMTISSTSIIPEPFIELMGTKYWVEVANPKHLWVWIAKIAVSKINDGPDRYTIPELEAIKNLVNGGDLSEKDCLQMTAWCSARLQALECADSAKEAVNLTVDDAIASLDQWMAM